MIINVKTGQVVDSTDVRYIDHSWRAIVMDIPACERGDFITRWGDILANPMPTGGIVNMRVILDVPVNVGEGDSHPSQWNWQDLVGIDTKFVGLVE